MNATTNVRTSPNAVVQSLCFRAARAPDELTAAEAWLGAVAVACPELSAAEMLRTAAGLAETGADGVGIQAGHASVAVH